MWVVDIVAIGSRGMNKKMTHPHEKKNLRYLLAARKSVIAPLSFSSHTSL